MSTVLFRAETPQELVTSGTVEPSAVGVRLMGPSTWSDGSPVRLVWVMLAHTGSFKGHPAGEFEMTSATFAEIKRNFDRRNLPIAFDVEHVSELPADRTDPDKGTVAHGWIHRLDNRGPGGLWGLVEWLDTARTWIKTGKYGYLSPAIRFDSRDTVTGANIGARLTSCALTNGPFLSQLPRLIAATDREPPHEVAPVAMSLTGLARKFMVERKLGYVDALDAATKAIAEGVRR